MTLFSFVYRCARKVWGVLENVCGKVRTIIKFMGNGVSYKNFRTGGTPYVMVARGGNMTIGQNFAMNNGINHNPIGFPQPCTFFVNKGCTITIGDNVGISQTALIALANITIGNNVKIGGGTCIYTSDFHSLDAKNRISENDRAHCKSLPVVIKDNVFIGSRCMILKGVTLGENSIIGAGSVVVGAIPANQIWAGNPARFIREI